MNFAELEAEIISEMYGTGAAAPKAKPVSNDEPNATDRELSEAMAYALTPAGRSLDPAGPQTIFAEQVRRAEAAAAAAGPVAEAPCRQSVDASVQVNEADWNTLRDLSGAVSPLTNRRYVEATDADGQRAREALFHARAAVLRGEKLDATMLAEIRANIASDQAAAARLQRERDAKELAEFREKHR